MPINPISACRHPGCAGLGTERGYCPAHKKEKAKLEDLRRGSAASRGYNYRWQKYVKYYINNHPLCVKCKAPADTVDHIIPIKGQDDPLFWDPDNHQSLCIPCHSAKTMAELVRMG